ncbi:MAG: glycosyltransferase family 87 protein [Flavobacteriales bacterium]|jgi:hypothetical protein
MKFFQKIIPFVSNHLYVLAIYVLLTIAATIQSIGGTKNTTIEGYVYQNYNNYVIFAKSFEHLKLGKDLYVAHPKEYWDLYKYTPTFSVFFGFFYQFPNNIGLFLWNLFNVLIVFAAIRYLPKLNDLQKGLLMLIVVVELMTSIQNEQSNGMIAGLIALGLGLAERKHYLWACFVIVFSAYVKLFGLVGFAIFLLYPKKYLTAIYSLLWIVSLFFIPLFFTSFEGLIKIYQGYWLMLKEDFDESYGLSVMGWLYSWFSLDLMKNAVVLAGVVVFLIPLHKFRLYSDVRFRLLLLCSILIWIVIFNHKAESPTFIIAMLGVGIWYMISEKNKLNTILFVSAILFTSLSPTDIFPPSFRNSVLKPYVMKAVPCIFIWFKIIYDMLRLNSEQIKKVNEAF